MREHVRLHESAITISFYGWIKSRPEAGAGPWLTHYAAHTSHSEGLRSPGTLRRKCTARSSPPAHGWPGRATHTHTHTWLKVHARFPARAWALAEVCSVRNTRFKRKRGSLWLSEMNSSAHLPHTSALNACKHTDGLRLRAVTNIPLWCSQRRPQFSRRSEDGSTQIYFKRYRAERVGEKKSKYPPAFRRSWAACEHLSRGPSSPALRIITLEFISTPAFLAFLIISHCMLGL